MMVILRNRLKAVHAGTLTGAVEKSFVYDDEGRLVSQGGTGAKTIQWNQVGEEVVPLDWTVFSIP